MCHVGCNVDEGEGNLVVGQFNSPHLLEPRDCVRINTRVVSEDIWRTSMELCRVAQEQGKNR